MRPIPRHQPVPMTSQVLRSSDAADVVGQLFTMPCHSEILSRSATSMTGMPRGRQWIFTAPRHITIFEN